MNKQRRAEIKKVSGIISMAMENLDAVVADEEFALDNIPENLRDSDRATEMEEGAEELRDIYDTLDELIDRLSEFYD